jgi:hypothetical protein
MNTVVVYYSGKGSNRFLAEKTASALKCNAVKLEPRAGGLVIPATATRLSFGNKPLKLNFNDYDSIILCGPLYMGSIAAPCNDFIRKYGRNIKRINFITCCASTDDKKDETFGYGRVFDKLKERLGEGLGLCEAFPIELLLSGDEKEDEQAMMNTRLNEGNYKGEIKERLGRFTSKLI